MVAFACLVGAMLYLATHPIPLPCVGCDTGGTFYRCMKGTGLGTITCEAYMSGKNSAKVLRQSLMSAEEYAKTLTAFASHLPQYLAEFASSIKQKIIELTADILARIKTVYSYAKQKLTEILSKAKDQAWEAIHKDVIRPFLTALHQYIVAPITSLIDKIITFSKFVLKEVGTVLDKGEHVVKEGYDAVYDASEKVSETVGLIFEQTAQTIEKMVAGIRTGVNSSIQEVVQTAESTLNTVTTAIEAVVQDTEQVINGVVQSTVGMTNSVVNDCGKALDQVVATTESEVNKAFQGVENATNKVMADVCHGVEDGVNDVGGAVVNGIGGVMTETETIVNDVSDGLQSAVNSVLGNINNRLSAPIEKALNSSANIVETAVNGLLVPVQGLAKGVNSLTDWKIGLGIFGDLHPLATMGYVDVPDGVKIPTITIPPIKNIDIPHVNIPTLQYVVPPAALGAAARAPSTNLESRRRLREVIRQAKKNWKIASNQATQIVVEKRCSEELYIRKSTQSRFYAAPFQKSAAHSSRKPKKNNLKFMPCNEDDQEDDDDEQDADGDSTLVVEHNANYDGLELEHQAALYLLFPNGGFEHLDPLGKSIFFKAVDALKEAGKKTEEALKKAAYAAKDLAVKAYNDAKDLAEKVAREAAALAVKVAAEAKALAERAIQEAKDLAQQVLDAAIKGIRDAIQKQEREYVAEAQLRRQAAAQQQSDVRAAIAAAQNKLDQTRAALQVELERAASIKAASADFLVAQYTAIQDAIIVNGIRIKAPKINIPPISLDKPNLRINLQQKGVSFKKIDLHRTFKVPTVKFAIRDISSEVPKIPNLMDGVSAAARILGKLLREFFAPVWSSLASLFTFATTVVTSIMHFFQTQVSWAKIRDGLVNGVRTGFRRTRVELMEFLHEKILAPFMEVLHWITVHVIELAKTFVKMTLAFFKNVHNKLADLAEQVWVKVKPILRETAVIGGGVAMYSVGKIVDRLIPLPVSLTSKVYIAVSLFLVLLIGAHTNFIRKTLTNALELAMTPVIILDQVVEGLVSRISFLRDNFFIKHVLGFDYTQFRPAC